MILKRTVLLFFFILFCLLARGNMGTCHSKSDKVKRDKNHNRQKMFKFGVSFGRNDLNLEGHLQMGYNSKTVKNYGPVGKQLDLPENTTSMVTEPNDQSTETEN